MSANLQPITSDGGFSTTGNIIVGNDNAKIVISSDAFEYQGASPAPNISGFNSATFPADVTSNNISLVGGYIKGGIPTVVDDGINAIYTGATTTMDVYGFPFTQVTRGQLTISGDIDPTQALGTWYYQSTNTNTFEIFTDSTYSTPVDSTGWGAYSGGADVAITKLSPPANVIIDSNGFLTKFDNTGNLTFPDNTTTSGSTIIVHGDYDIQSDGNTTIKTSAYSSYKEWKFDNTGNLTLPGNTFAVNYANGTQVSLGGGSTPNALANGSALFTLMSDNTLLSGNSTSPQNFKVNDTYTPDIDLRNASGTGMYTQGANLTIRTAGTYNWNFDNSGNLSTQGDVKVAINTGNLVLGHATATGSPGLSSTSSVTISANRDGTVKQMTFDTTGGLSLPGNISATNIGNIASANLDGNASNILLGNGVFSGQSSLRTLTVPDTFANTSSGSSLAITSSMYRILINAGSSSSYTFTLPDTNTCYIGQSFVLASAQAVTQNYGYTIALFGGGSSGQTWTAGTNIVATCVAQRGGSAEATTNWKYSYQGGVAVTGTGAQVFGTSPSISGASMTGAFDTSGAYMMTSLVGEKFQTWSYTVGGVTATPTAVSAGGAFTIPSTSGLSTGQSVTITGTNGGTGSISGYSSGTTYYIIATPAPGGATSITLSASRNSATAITTTAGTLSGLTMTFGAQVGFNPYGQFGHIINLTGTINSNFDISYVGVNQTNPAYNVTLIINQGATPYIPQNFYVGSYGGYVGTAATINWAGGVTPTGTANKKDVISLSWLQNTQFAPAIVLGQLVSYG